MKVTLNIPYFLGAIAAFVVAYMTVTESIDQYIHFAGELNALGFTVFALFLGMICTIGAFERPKPVK
jgi:hypothetical protein